ncbi:MAG: hypothetical protein JKP98_07320 [Rhodobacteraceae bacterium]|nr:hypothetical protein [Paracoccaceae bacterium]
MILGGDFNMVPWSHGVRALARAAGGSVARPALSTRPVRGMPLPIDHVIAPGGQRDPPAAARLGSFRAAGAGASCAALGGGSPAPMARHGDGAALGAGGLLAAGLIALLFSFAGRWHPAADTLAVFRPGVALACLPFVALLGRRHWLFWPGLALVLAVLAIRAWDDRPGRGPAPGFTVYQKNMYFGMQDHAPLARDIRAAAPDFVTLQEVTRGNAAMLAICRTSCRHSMSARSRRSARSRSRRGSRRFPGRRSVPKAMAWSQCRSKPRKARCGSCRSICTWPGPWPGRPGRAAGPAPARSMARC